MERAKNYPQVESKFGFLLKKVAWANDKFVATGENGTIEVSYDGVYWKPVYQDKNASFRNVVWSETEKGFFATGTRGHISFSKDGFEWVKISKDDLSLYAFEHMATFKDIDIIVGGGGLVARIKYLSHTVEVINAGAVDGQQLYDVASNGNVIVTVGTGGRVRRSTDGGLTWSLYKLNTIDDLVGIAYGGGAFVAVGPDGTIIRSTDGGNNWYQPITGLGNDIKGITYSNGRFIAVGSNGLVLTSINGATWNYSVISSSVQFNKAEYNGSAFVVVGNNGKIFTSTDGQTWTQRSSGTTQNLESVVWDGSKFIAVGNNGTILTSPDGITWTSTVSGFFQANLTDVFVMDSSSNSIGYKIIAIGRSGKAFGSNDGIKWFPLNTEISTNMNGGAWCNGKYVIVGCHDCISISNDGATWTQVLGHY
ncbi:WD40/YVTN/BNR-like repeat-containing protein [Ruminiclostridium josui]|uniref:WD40/YVTN/BNR-like repeat-containing protein n=1 Tax=Ruminiclostridium josui TaxID=1499 RepID=UPI001FA6B3AE|nr:hypothetical protein [Ruminiclostridium josui]